MAPAGAKAGELPGVRRSVGVVQVVAGSGCGRRAGVSPPPVVGSIFSNATRPTSIRVRGSVTSPVALDQINSCLRLDAAGATVSSRVVLMMPI